MILISSSLYNNTYDDPRCVQEKYDSNNEKHKKCKAEIELGNGLPDLNTTTGAMAMLEQAGFEVLI